MVRRAALGASLALVGAGMLPVGAQSPGGHLTVWDWQYTSPTWGAALKEIDEAFIAANPGVTIEHVGQPNDTYYQLIQAANAAQSGPDVAMMHAGTFGVLNYPDSLEPLNDRITPEMRDAIDGWESVGAGFDADGTIYGVPGSRSGWVFYYNKDLFRQAGLDPDVPPSTYDELIAAADALKAAGITPFGGGNQDGWGHLQYLNILFPGEFSIEESLQLANGELPYNGEKFKAVNQRLVDIVQAGYFDPGYASTLLWTDGVQQFKDGKQAMIAGIASDTVSYNEFNPALGEDNVGVFYAPAMSQADPYIPDSAGPVWTMTTYAKDKDLAWRYIDFLTGPEGARIQYETAGVLPINKGYTPPGDAPPQVRQMVEDFNTKPTLLYVSSLMKQAVVFDWMKQMQSVLNGDLSLDEALDAVQAVQEQP
jgi:ABC-type glycerol-3-phosphate transport system substrate-binding protein